MNNIIANYEQIQAFAKEYSLPLAKTRAIIREYLQSRVLELLYREKISKQYAFVGGTSLRLLHGLDRFSEDLDFDLLTEVSNEEVTSSITAVSVALKKENIAIELYQNTTPARTYFELRFPKLLYQLKIGRHEDEKLMIKLDFERFWKGLKRNVYIFDRYGVLAHIVSLSLNQLLVQKLYAYIHRKQTLVRDIYDVVWLVSHGARLDLEMMTTNYIQKTIVNDALQKYTDEQKKLPTLARRLQPFLLEEDAKDKLSFFPHILAKLR